MLWPLFFGGPNICSFFAFTRKWLKIFCLKKSITLRRKLTWEQDLIENLHYVLKTKDWPIQSHKKLTNLSDDLRTKHMLITRSDSLHPIASHLSMLQLSIVLHCFLLKRPIDYRKFWLHWSFYFFEWASNIALSLLLFRRDSIFHIDSFCPACYISL